MLDDAARKQRGRPFKPGTSGNPRGRPKGSRNKRTRMQAEAAAAAGQLPLDFLLCLMRDPTAPVDRRLEAARCAAPYCHSRPAPSRPQECDLTRLSDEELDAFELLTLKALGETKPSV
jgi:hypothetical protein